LAQKELTKKSSTLIKVAKVSGAVGGVLGTVDNALQGINDFSEGNYVRGTINTTQSAAYAVGTALLFVPGGQAIGAAILLTATVSDWIQSAIEFW